MDWRILQLFGVEMLFRDLTKYSEMIESFLQIEKQKLEDSFSYSEIEEHSKQAGEEQNQYLHHLMDSYIEEHQLISSSFPNNFRSFFITQVMSTVEAELKRITNFYVQKDGQKFFVEDMPGTNELDRCKKFLKIVFGIDFGQFNPEWNFLNSAKTLRNKIVHHENQIGKDDNIFDFLARNDSVTLEPYPLGGQNIMRFTIIDGRLGDQLISNAERFFNKLLQALKSASS